MSSTPPFLTNENMKLLWDVLIENELFQNKQSDFFVKVNTIFNENIQGFYESEISYSNNNNNHNKLETLIGLNKKFITLFINHIQKLLHQQNQIKPLTHNNLNTSLITHEDIQNDRMNQFEKNLNQVKQDFTNAMALPVPPVPEFKDKMDEPISELELEIKRTMAQRNYDIEVIHNNIHNLQDGSNSWLKSQETSVKKDKMNPNQNLNQNLKSNPNQNVIKHIKIENNNLDNSILKKDIIDLNTLKKEKHVSWVNDIENNGNGNNDIENIQENIDDSEYNLFRKLKVISKKPEESPDYLISRMENMETKLQKIEEMLQILIKK
jgi:hypothetical protein